MKRSRKRSLERALPAQDEYRRFNVLQEKMLSEFRTFGESLSDVRERVSRMEPDLRAVREDFALLKTATRSHTLAINAHTEAIHSMQADFKKINQRLEVVEAKLAS